MNTLIATLSPIYTPAGHSPLLGWLLTVIILCVVVWVVVWGATKVLGPPNIPEPVKWILWVVVAIALLIFIFAAFGITI